LFGKKNRLNPLIFRAFLLPTKADFYLVGIPLESEVDAMYHFFMLQNMFVVGSSYWAMAYGQMPGDVQKDEEGLDTMRNLGRNMAYLLNVLEERRNN
jgi:multimeric flavodoxin WrbA